MLRRSPNESFKFLALKQESKDVQILDVHYDDSPPARSGEVQVAAATLDAMEENNDTPPGRIGEEHIEYTNYLANNDPEKTEPNKFHPNAFKTFKIEQSKFGKIL